MGNQMDCCKCNTDLGAAASAPDAPEVKRLLEGCRNDLPKEIGGKMDKNSDFSNPFVVPAASKPTGSSILRKTQAIDGRNTPLASSNRPDSEQRMEERALRRRQSAADRLSTISNLSASRKADKTSSTEARSDLDPFSGIHSSQDTPACSGSSPFSDSHSNQHTEASSDSSPSSGTNLNSGKKWSPGARNDEDWTPNRVSVQEAKERRVVLRTAPQWEMNTQEEEPSTP